MNDCVCVRECVLKYMELFAHIVSLCISDIGSRVCVCSSYAVDALFVGKFLIWVDTETYTHTQTCGSGRLWRWACRLGTILMVMMITIIYAQSIWVSIVYAIHIVWW